MGHTRSIALYHFEPLYLLVLPFSISQVHGSVMLQTIECPQQRSPFLQYMRRTETMIVADYSATLVPMQRALLAAKCTVMSHQICTGSLGMLT